MFYRHLIDNCSDTGIVPAAKRLADILSSLSTRQHASSKALLDLPDKSDDLNAIKRTAEIIRKRFKAVVVVGIGGSGLSGRTLLQLQSPDLPFHFLENIDPTAMDELLAVVDWKHTAFLIISKSGGTVEVLSQFYVLLELAKSALGGTAKDHFFLITSEKDNPLRRAGIRHGLAMLNHADDIGGRFSILTNVGLLPAAIAGLNIDKLRQGAKSVVQELESAATPEQCAPALGAATQYAHLQAGKHITVMLPYCERLSVFSAWYRQLWAESLGKQGRGSTPIRAVGATDQHSQLQLYLDGPKDKLFHMILLKRAGTGKSIPIPEDDPELSYLKNKTIGDIMAAEQKATLESLVRNGSPVRVINIDTLNEETLGALLMHFMLEVIFMAELLKIDPFDQPAVEEGKNLARDYLLTGNI